MEYKFIEKTIKQLKQNYNARNKANLNDFENFNEFNNWYNNEEKNCKYCGISEEEVQKIVVLGILKSKRFPLNGQTKRGRACGMWLEVDKFDPNQNYSINNCVLTCYFCNNDKSDVFGGLEYVEFFQNRANFLRNLLNK